MQEHWAPAPRLLISATGGGLAIYGVRRGDALGGLLGALGLGLLARGTTNFKVERVLGLGAGRRAGDVQKTITIDAPVEEVFRRPDHEPQGAAERGARCLQQPRHSYGRASSRW
jgi:uncharacterized membrane protein